MSSKRGAAFPCGRPRSDGAKAPCAAEVGVWRERLQKFVATEGLKFSEQRWQIAETILSMAGHSDAQGIVARVKRVHPKIGAATVYRNLKLLCAAGILKESLLDSEGRTLYELADEGHHDHVVCTDCGEIFEFEAPEIEAQQARVVERMRFEEVRHRHIVYAHCRFKRLA